MEMICFFRSSEDLHKTITNLFEKFDVNESGGLSFEQFRHGLSAMDLPTKISFTSDDWEVLTLGGKLLNADGRPSSPSHTA